MSGASLALHSYGINDLFYGSPSVDTSVEEKMREVSEHFYSTITNSLIRENLRDKLDSCIVECSEDDWDGYGALKILQDSIASAIKFIGLLPINVREPEVNVDPDGEISFDWELNNNDYFSVSIGKNGKISYAGLNGIKKCNGTLFLQDTIPNVVLEHCKEV